ncbi:MAG: translocation/assembly module TamB domain-containing protein [Granulosicoccus sp.]|nr:translocation/assembly module TamB domain-containing protein [Granulosicoccus sp.]
MIKRILKIIGISVLLLLLVIVGVLGWVLGTEKGFEQSLALAKKHAPGTLHWQDASGKFTGPLHILGLQYTQEDGLDLQFGDISFDWLPVKLVSGTLDINQLHLSDVTLKLPKVQEQSAAETTSNALPDIALPLSIALNDIVVSNLTVYPPGANAPNAPIEISELALSANMTQSDVSIAMLDVTAPQGELHLRGDINTAGRYPMDISLDWLADIGQASPLKGEGTIVGDLVGDAVSEKAQLQIDQQVSGFATAKLSGSLSNVLSAPSWQATIMGSVPDPEALSPLINDVPRIVLVTSGSPDDFQAIGTVAVSTSESGPVSVDTRITGSTEEIVIQSLDTQLIDNGGSLSLTGAVTLADLNSNIQGQWQRLSYPVAGDPQFASPEGTFKLVGNAENFTLEINTQVQGEAIPEGQWVAMLDGSATALSQFEIQGQTLDGSITASGSADWDVRPSWDIQLVSSGINPQSYVNEFPGSVNLELASAGVITDEGPIIKAVVERLDGQLREHPLSGSGNIFLDGETLIVDQLNLAHGDSLLVANGTIDEQLALDVELSSATLNQLMPELEGSIDLTGNISGSKDSPVVKANGRADELVFAANEVGELSFNVEAGLDESAALNVVLDANDIIAGGQQISDVRLRAQGTQAQHELTLSAATTAWGELATELDGAISDNAWDGTLALLSLENTPAGTWRLRKPVAMSGSAEKAEAGTLCLDNSDKLGSLCMAANWLAGGETTATLNISNLSPQLAADYLPVGFEVETHLDGEARALLGADGSVNASGSFALAAGKLVIDDQELPVEIKLEETRVELDWQGDDGSFALDTALTDFGTLNARATISDPAGAGLITGKLETDFDDLTLISSLVPQVQQVAGVLQSDLSLTGSVESPVIEGTLNLSDFTAEIPEVAMLIKDTQFNVSGKPDGTLLINGQANSGEGQLSIDGTVNPGTRRLEIAIDGDEFQVANTALMQVVISPQLAIAMDNSGMQVNGSVVIPEAYINANGSNEGIKTVSASSDVVFVSDNEEELVDEQGSAALNLDVQVILGDSVEIEAGDFRGRLEGELTVEQTPELAPRGTGTIDVVNGDYVVYGQQLQMERGRISFSGGPVDNPSLDMEVARTVLEYDVVAGAKILGTAESPRLELYSEPTMPDSSILSFILLGQPPGVGASYTLGKYLTPELYVSYGIGLFDAINTFNLRYSLTDRLSLESVSGSGNSADLIYTIER